MSYGSAARMPSPFSGGPFSEKHFGLPVFRIRLEVVLKEHLFRSRTGGEAKAKGFKELFPLPQGELA
jgi:hypothetical protein